MSHKLTVTFNATDNVWYAYNGASEQDSRWIGQGIDAAHACADYWYQAIGSAAELIFDEAQNVWKLEQDSWAVAFDTKQEAVDFANANDWQIKGKF